MRFLQRCVFRAGCVAGLRGEAPPLLRTATMITPSLLYPIDSKPRVRPYDLAVRSIRRHGWKPHWKGRLRKRRDRARYARDVEPIAGLRSDSDSGGRGRNRTTGKPPRFPIVEVQTRDAPALAFPSVLHTSRPARDRHRPRSDIARPPGAAAEVGARRYLQPLSDTTKIDGTLAQPVAPGIDGTIAPRIGDAPRRRCSVHAAATGS